MTRTELNNQYFNWMYDIVKDRRYTKGRQYGKIIRYLNDIDFVVLLPMDDNRSSDGINLRYRFGDDVGCDSRLVASLLDDHPCTVLEMMIALSFRCEDEIMYNPDIGYQIGKWFWEMIINLGLMKMDDDHFDLDYIHDAIYRMMYREYEPNGKGGLFIIRNATQDLRNIELWYQACWYLDEVLVEGGFDM